MNELENIKLKIHELNEKSNEAFQEFIKNELIVEKNKHLKTSLEHAEESYKKVKGLRNVPSDVFDFDLAKFRLEYNLIGLYMLSNKHNEAKKCLDKIRYSPKLKESDKFKQKKLIVLIMKLAIYYASANKADFDSFERLLECFSFIMEYFFVVFDFKDETYVKRFRQLLSMFVHILSNDKENIKECTDYAKKIIDYKDIDSKLDVTFSKLFSDLALNFAGFDYDISKSLFEKSFKILTMNDNLANNEVIFAIINNNLMALYNRYKKIEESTELRNLSLEILKQKLEEKKDNKFLKFQLSDCCFNLGYAYAKEAEYENPEVNYKTSKEYYWLSFSEAKSILYASNQYESLEAIATIDLRNSEFINSLEYFNMALKIYNKSTGSQAPDEINRRLNNKIKMIQGKINEINLKDFLNKKKKKLNDEDSEETDDNDEDDDDDDDLIKDNKKLVNGFNATQTLNKLKLGITTMNKLNSLKDEKEQNNSNNEEGGKHKDYGKKSVGFTNSKPDIRDIKDQPTTDSVPLNSERSTTTTGSSGTKSTTNSTSTNGTSASHDTKSNATESNSTGETSSSHDQKPDDGKKSSKDKGKKDVAFDKNAYEHTVQQLIRQNLIRKQPEIPILYEDFNKGKVPKRIPQETSSTVCTIA